jgi:hypothetical protein
VTVLLTAPMPPRDANGNTIPMPPSAVFSVAVPEAGVLNAVAPGAETVWLLDAAGTVLATGTAGASARVGSATSIVLVVERPAAGTITV